VLPHRLQKREVQRSLIELTLHLRERTSKIGITRPLDAIDFEFGDQLTQVCNPLQQDAGFMFRWQVCEGFYRVVICERSEGFRKRSLRASRQARCVNMISIRAESVKAGSRRFSDQDLNKMITS
jgi:hypothetical protein